MNTQISCFNEDADISLAMQWDERRNEYVPVAGSYFDHAEMMRIPDEIGEEILKRFSFPKNFSH